MMDGSSSEISDNDNEVMMMVDLPKRPRPVVVHNRQMYPEPEPVLSSPHVSQNPKRTVNESGITGPTQMSELPNTDDLILPTVFEPPLPTSVEGSSNSSSMGTWNSIHFCISVLIIWIVFIIGIGASVFIIVKLYYSRSLGSQGAPNFSTQRSE